MAEFADPYEYASPNGGPPAWYALPLKDFLNLELPDTPAILGEGDDVLIAAGGLTVLAGMPNAGKTTLAVDLAYHLASGQEWLGVPCPKPPNILFIENEGPERAFQKKLQRKQDAWQHELHSEIYVKHWNWGACTLRDQYEYQSLLEFLDNNDIALVIGDPLDTLGPMGIGSPEDTREFLTLLVPLGLTRARSFLFLHHFRKEVTINEINQVSGAWGARLDTLIILKETENQDQIRVSFPKHRWSERRDPLIIEKQRDTAGFEVVATEQPAASPTAVEGMLRTILSVLRQYGPLMERPALAIAAGTWPGDGSFLRALRTGLERDLLASERSGKKTTYSLTESSWFSEE